MATCKQKSVLFVNKDAAKIRFFLASKLFFPGDNRAWEFFTLSDFAKSDSIANVKFSFVTQGKTPHTDSQFRILCLSSCGIRGFDLVVI